MNVIDWRWASLIGVPAAWAKGNDDDMISLMSLALPAALAVAGGMAAYEVWYRWGREPEIEPDYLELLPMANDLRERALYHKSLSRQKIILENNAKGGAADDPVEISFPSGSETVRIRLSRRDAETLLENSMVQAEEDMEETILFILKWYRDNVAPLPPVPKEEYQRKHKFWRSPKNVCKSIPEKSGGRPQIYFPGKVQERPQNYFPDAEMFRIAWRRKGDSLWHIEGFADSMAQSERQVELVFSMGEELDRVILPPHNQKLTMEKFRNFLDGGLTE